MTLRPTSVVAAAAAALAVLPASAQAEQLVGVDARSLVAFDSERPSATTSTPITGLADGERPEGIDVRPGTGSLFLVTNANRLYEVVRATGQATPVGTAALDPALNGTGFGFDFNPAVDRIRLTSNFGQNLRLNPTTGAVAATDGTLAFVEGDANRGKRAAVAGSAYTNSVLAPPSTQLFAIDTANDVLALQDPPNPGGLRTIGPLNAGDVTSPVGFDIAGPTGNAYATLKIAKRKGTALYTIDYVTGRASRVGNVGPARAPITLRGLAVVG